MESWGIVYLLSLSTTRFCLQHTFRYCFGILVVRYVLINEGDRVIICLPIDFPSVKARHDSSNACCFTSIQTRPTKMERPWTDWRVELERDQLDLMQVINGMTDQGNWEVAALINETRARAKRLFCLKLANCKCDCSKVID